MVGGAVQVNVFPGEVIFQVVLVQAFGDPYIADGCTLKRRLLLTTSRGLRGIGVQGLEGRARRLNDYSSAT